MKRRVCGISGPVKLQERIMSKVTIICTCTAILLTSAAVAWGTASRAPASATMPTVTPLTPELQLRIDVGSLPQQQMHDMTFVFAD